jgi:hypothetical protein
MVYVTSQAKEILNGLIGKRDDMRTKCLRLTDLGHDKIGIEIDYRHEEDTLVDKGHGFDLVIEHQLAALSSGISLDAYDTPEGSRLVISKEVVRRAHPCVTISWVSRLRIAPEPSKPPALTTG